MKPLLLGYSFNITTKNPEGISPFGFSLKETYRSDVASAQFVKQV